MKKNFKGQNRYCSRSAHKRPVLLLSHLSHEGAEGKRAVNSRGRKEKKGETEKRREIPDFSYGFLRGRVEGAFGNHGAGKTFARRKTP